MDCAEIQPAPLRAMSAICDRGGKLEPTPPHTQAKNLSWASGNEWIVRNLGHIQSRNEWIVRNLGHLQSRNEWIVRKSGHRPDGAFWSLLAVNCYGFCRI